MIKFYVKQVLFSFYCKSSILKKTIQNLTINNIFIKIKTKTFRGLYLIECFDKQKLINYFCFKAKKKTTIYTKNLLNFKFQFIQLKRFKMCICFIV